MIAFDHPWALAGWIAIPLAIWLLLLRRRPVEISVPSLLHWQAVPDADEEGVRRLRLEGLASILRISIAIFAIVAAIAGPVITLDEGQGRALIVIDRSASMQGTVDGTSKLEIAKAAATDLVRSFRGSIQIRVGSLPAGRPEADLSAADAVAAIQRVQPSILPLDPETILPDILPPPDRGERVFLFTDRVPSWADDGDVWVYSAGVPSDNVGITEFEAGPAHVFVSVGNFSDRTLQVPVLMEGWDTEGAVTSVGVELRIEAGSEEVWRIDVPPFDRVEVRQRISDSFPLDDRVQAAGIVPEAFRCRVIGGPCPAIERALAAIPGVEVIRAPDESADLFSLTIYYQQIPPDRPIGPFVLVDPPTAWGGVSLGEPLEEGEELLPAGDSWADLDLSGVLVRGARELKGREIDPMLLGLPSGRTVAGILAGADWRAVVIGFDPETIHTNWPERVSYPVFWAKVAEWAGLPRAGARVLRGGERIRYPLNFPPGRLVGPDGALLAEFAEARSVSWLPEAQGIYSGEDSAVARLFSCNLLRIEESDHGGVPRALPDDAHEIPLDEPTSVQGWPLLVCLFVLLVSLEWFRRRERMAP